MVYIYMFYQVIGIVMSVSQENTRTRRARQPVKNALEAITREY